MLGDHQPPAAVSGEGASWNVPVHVVSDRPEVIEALVARGSCATAGGRCTRPDARTRATDDRIAERIARDPLTEFARIASSLRPADFRRIAVWSLGRSMFMRAMKTWVSVGAFAVMLLGVVGCGRGTCGRARRRNAAGLEHHRHRPHDRRRFAPQRRQRAVRDRRGRHGNGQSHRRGRRMYFRSFTYC